MGVAIRSVTMIGNNAGISRVFTNRVAQRAFVYPYVGDVVEVTEYLRFLEKKSLDVLAKQSTDEADGDGADY